jgi:SAM-dependent methyltransferase
MQTTDVHAIEIAKWDALASVPTADNELMVAHADFAAYAREDATMVGIAEFVGDLRGQEVLELGSGMGEMTTLLARSGAHVTAVDISPASIALGRRRARLHRVDAAIDFVVAAGEQLPLDPGRFDVVVGKAVLHHLDVDRAAPELHRVLRAGGRAAFAEPLGTNPLIAFAREHLPYPGKNPRGADVPLSYDDIRAWEAPFSSARHREIQLLAMAERALGRGPMPRLRGADDWLLKRFPALGRLCRYVIVTMVR